MKRYTKAEIAPVILACIAAADAVSTAANRRHMCEQSGSTRDLNSVYYDASEARALIDPTRKALGVVRDLCDALSVGAVDEDYAWEWGDVSRIRKVNRLASITSAQIGGTPALDWGHAAELRWFAETLTRCGS